MTKTPSASSKPTKEAPADFDFEAHFVNGPGVDPKDKSATRVVTCVHCRKSRRRNATRDKAHIWFDHREILTGLGVVPVKNSTPGRRRSLSRKSTSPRRSPNSFKDMPMSTPLRGSLAAGKRSVERSTNKKSKQKTSPCLVDLSTAGTPAPSRHSSSPIRGSKASTSSVWSPAPTKSQISKFWLMLVEGCFVNDFPVDRFLKDENITLALDRLRPGYAKSSANICLDVSHMEQSIVQEALARAVHTISSKVSRQPLAALAIQVHESEARMSPCAITACACIWQGSKDRAGEACTVPLRGTMLPEHLSTMSTASSGPRLVHSSDMGGATVVGVATDNQILADAFASRSPSQLIVMSFSDTLKGALEACLRADDAFKPTIKVVKELLELLEAYKADTRCPALPSLAANWTSKLEFVIENWRSIKNYLSDMGEQENWRSMKAGLRMIHSNVSQAFLPPEAQQGFQTVVEKLRSVETLIQKLNDPSTSLFRGICLIGDFLGNELVLPEIERASIFILNYFGWLRRFDPPAYQDTDEWIRENASGIATDIQRFNDRRVADGIPAVPLDAGASTLVDYFNRDGEHADISVPLMKKMTAFQYWRQKHSSDAFAKYIFWSTICPCNVDEARHIFRG